MLRVREYGDAGPRVIVLHGGPGAAGHMAPVARGSSGSYHVIEPLQRGSGGERLTVARHVADLHEIANVYAERCHPVLGASWGAMLALAYAAAHPDATGRLILVGGGTFDLGARAELERSPAAFAAIKVPVLMIHWTYDPLPGRLIVESLRPCPPQLEYRELDHCGHYL